MHAEKGLNVTPGKAARSPPDPSDKFRSCTGGAKAHEVEVEGRNTSEQAPLAETRLQRLTTFEVRGPHGTTLAEASPRGLESLMSRVAPPIGASVRARPSITGSVG